MKTKKAATKRSVKSVKKSAARSVRKGAKKIVSCSECGKKGKNSRTHGEH